MTNIYYLLTEIFERCSKPLCGKWVRSKLDGCFAPVQKCTGAKQSRGGVIRERISAIWRTDESDRETRHLLPSRQFFSWWQPLSRCQRRIVNREWAGARLVPLRWGKRTTNQMRANETNSIWVMFEKQKRNGIWYGSKLRILNRKWVVCDSVSLVVVEKIFNVYFL